MATKTDAEVSRRDETPQLVVRVERAIKDAFDAECVESETNKTVLLNKILARRYRISYKPSEVSKRRRTPHGGGPRT